MRNMNFSGLTMRMAVTLGLCAALFWVASCNANGTPESDRQVQQQAQEATEHARVAADKAAAEARVAAANAEREANDVARGVKAGLHDGKTGGKGGDGIDLNSASRADLETLPGVNALTARRIEEHRPYGTPHDLVKQGVVSEAEYNRIAGDVVAR